MRVNLVGFRLEAGYGLSMVEVFDYLAQQRSKPIRFGEHERLIYLASSDAHYFGLFLTIKDHSKIPSIRRQQDEFQIEVTALADGTSVVDFNFFVISRETWAGLYSHYHHSCSINQFGIFCRTQADALRRERKDGALAHVHDRAEAKRVRAQFKGDSLKCVVMIRRENLPVLLQQLERIKTFEYDMETLDAVEPLLSPIRPHLRRQSHCLRFVKDENIKATVINWIGDFIESRSPTKARVEGIDSSGRNLSFGLLDNPDSFGTFDLASIVDANILKTRDFQDSSFVKQMLGIVQKNGTLFETRCG
jgi:hypothetical protein